MTYPRKANALWSLLFAVLAFGTARAQNPEGLEKSLFGVQTGFLGIWVHNESKVAEKLILRSEIGLDAGFGGGGSYNQFYQVIGVTEGLVLVPSVTLEPRYHYNILSRASRSKNTEKNSSSFIALRVKYFPDWFAIGQDDETSITTSQISFIPKWGLKRTIGSHITYEMGIGAGYFTNIDFTNSLISSFDENGFMLDLHLRVGYTF